MVPNHIMQLITLTAMEPPVSFRADAVRDEQSKILHAIQPLSSEDVLTRTVRGQYGEGVIAGQQVPAYRTEQGVPPDSKTETFVAMKLAIDNWRWADVPFYLRTGKRMPVRNTHIVIQFRRAPFVLFRDTPVENLVPNQLVLHIQPEEGISLRFAAKAPGAQMRLGTVDMNFEYCGLFRRAVQHGVRTSSARLHDRGPDAISARRHGRSGMVRGESGAGCMARPAAAKFPELRLGNLGPEGRRRPARTRWPSLEKFREMILAGDIGGTNARLAYFQSQNGHLSLATEGVFPSREHRGLDEIVAKFVEGQSAGRMSPASALLVRSATARSKLQTCRGPSTLLASSRRTPTAECNAHQRFGSECLGNPQLGRKRSRFAEPGEEVRRLEIRV